MRKNLKEVINAFLDNKACRKADSIWTNGDHIYSYGTCIMIRNPEDFGPLYILNRTKYSHTTSTHQNALSAYFRASAFMVYGIGRGRHAEALEDAFRAAMRADAT